jgi:hypothetical protein
MIAARRKPGQPDTIEVSGLERSERNGIGNGRARSRYAIGMIDLRQELIEAVIVRERVDMPQTAADAR